MDMKSQENNIRSEKKVKAEPAALVKSSQGASNRLVVHLMDSTASCISAILQQNKNKNHRCRKYDCIDAARCLLSKAQVCKFPMGKNTCK